MTMSGRPKARDMTGFASSPDEVVDGIISPAVNGENLYFTF